MSTVGPLNRTKCEFLISAGDDMALGSTVVGNS